MWNTLLVAALVGSATVAAQGINCDLDNKCPESSPCCSQFGQCGVGAYCLGGCDPRMSHSLTSCVPEPVCQDSTTTFKNLDSIVNINKYLGDPKDGTWVAQGQPLHNDDTVLLTMPKDSTGTLLSSTTYMWYGNVKARMKTSRGKGVVTAFILFSDVKDEIDYEFVGVDLETAQTNYYFQGIPDYTHSANISISDTFDNFHDYEIRWTPDQIQWLVDGQVGRTQKKADTWNHTTQSWDFPQSPARVQFSLWPAGNPSNPKGTIDWAGGIIDWNTPDIKDPGFYYATIESVSMECYNGKDGQPGSNSGKSYTYDNGSGLNNTIVDGNKDTVLASLEGSGDDMNAGAQSASKTSSGHKSDKTSAPAQIPGQGGASGQDHSGSDSNQSGASSESGGSDSSGGSSGSSGSTSGNSDVTPENCDPSKFNANCDGSSNGGSGSGTGGNSGSTKSSASALAIVIAGAAMYWL